MVIYLVRDNHGLFGWIQLFGKLLSSSLQLFGGCNCWLLECVSRLVIAIQWLQCTHTGTGYTQHMTLLSLSANYTVYLLTHDIALSLFQPTTSCYND